MVEDKKILIPLFPSPWDKKAISRYKQATKEATGKAIELTEVLIDGEVKITIRKPPMMIMDDELGKWREVK